MSNEETLPNSFVDKYGGTSVITKEQDLAIVDRTFSKAKRVSDSGYSILVTSGMGQVDETPDGRKLTNHMYDIVEGIRVDHAWSIVKKRITDKLAAHEISEEHFSADFRRLEGILKSGDEISERDKPYIIGFPELMQAKILQLVGSHRNNDKEWVLVSWPDSPIPLGLIGQKGHGRIDVPIDHEQSLINIADVARKAKLAGKIAVIPGFVGSLSRQHLEKLVTLERGSSDATATYWGAALGLEKVVIYSDRAGILPIDPRIVDGLKPLKELTYLEAHLYAGWGAGIIQQLAIRPLMDSVRRNRETQLIIRSSMEPDLPGTKIGGRPYVENFGVKAIAYVPNRTAIIIRGISDRPGSGAAVEALFGKHGISVDHIVDGVNKRAHFVDTNNPQIGALLQEISQIGYRYCAEGPYTRIALVGAGMDLAQRVNGNQHATNVLTNTLRELGIPIDYRTLFGGDISHSVFVEQQYGKLLVNTLARNLGIINGK